MQTYINNTPVLTDYGDWRFEGPLSVEEAQAILQGGFISAIGHPAAAQFLSQLLGVVIPDKRQAICTAPGDRILVLRLLNRLPEGRLLTFAEMEAFPFELGVLTHLA